MKIEANCYTGIEIVDEFDEHTNVWNDGKTILTIDDFIEELGVPFQGTIGWIATDEDYQFLKKAGYLK